MVCIVWFAGFSAVGFGYCVDLFLPRVWLCCRFGTLVLLSCGWFELLVRLVCAIVVVLYISLLRVV